MPHVIVGRWGKNLAIRVPSEIARTAGLRDGERVEIEAHDAEIVIRRTIPPVSLGDMFRGKSAEEWRKTYTRAYEWGPDIGRETVEE